MVRLRLRIPFQQSLDILLRYIDAVFEAQQVLQQNLQGERQAADVLRLERMET
jgi:hypothetical protein